MSLPAATATASVAHIIKGNERNGVYERESGLTFASPSTPLPTIIEEERETWSKKAAYRNRHRTAKDGTSPLPPSNTFSHMNLLEKTQRRGDEEDESEDDEVGDLLSSVDFSWTEEAYREDVHFVSRSSSSSSLLAEEEAMIMGKKVVSVAKRALHSQQSSRLHRTCFSNSSNNNSDSSCKSADDDEYEYEYDEDEDADKALTNHHKSASCTPSNSSPFSLAMTQRVLSTLMRPFTKSGRQSYANRKESQQRNNRRNRRTQTDTRYMQLPLFGSHHSKSKSSHLNIPSEKPDLGEVKGHQRFLQAPSLISFTNPGRSSGSFPLCFKLLLRQLRFPLAILCFVFLFVIQFREPQHAINGLIQQQSSSSSGSNSAANVAAPQAAVSLLLTSSSSSSSSSLQPFASAILLAANAGGGSGNGNSSSLVVEKRLPLDATASTSMGVAAPVGSNVLVNRDLQAMPVAAAVVVSQMDTTEGMATSASSPSHQLANISMSSLVNDSSSSDISSVNSSVTGDGGILPIKSPCPLIPTKLGRLPLVLSLLITIW